MRKNYKDSIKYNDNTFYKHLYNSNLIICSGGLILFDCLFLKKKILCIPNDKYQQQNIQNILKIKKHKIFFQNSLKYLDKNVIKALNLKNYKSRFYIKNMKYTLKIIYSYIYD